MNVKLVSLITIFSLVGVAVGYGISLTQISSLQSDISNLQSNVSDLQSKFSTMTTDYEGLNATYNELVTSYSNFQTAFNALTTDFNNLNVTYNNLFASYQGLVTNYEYLNATYFDLLADHQELATLYDDLSVMYNDLAAKYLELEMSYRLERSASYIIRVNGSTIEAINGSTGRIDYNGTDASTVIQSAIDALSSGRTRQETIVVKGNYTVDTTINISSYTILDLSNALFYIEDGQNNFDIFQNADTTNGNEYIDIIGGFFVCNPDLTSNPTAIHFTKGNNYNIIRSKTKYVDFIWFDTVTDSSVVGTEHYKSYYIGVYLDDCERIRVIGNQFWGGYEAAVEIYESSAESKRNLVALNTVWGNKMENAKSYSGGIWSGIIVRGDDNIIAENTIENCVWIGIDVTAPGSAYADDNIVVLNRATDMGVAGVEDGIGIQVSSTNTRRTIVKLNIVGGNLDYGIKDMGTDTVIKDNAGYVTENSGTTTIANNEWVAHGLATTPTIVTGTTRTATYGGVPVIVGWVGQNATHFQVSAYWSNSTAITDDVINIIWYAEA